MVVLPFPVWHREQEGTTRTQWASPDLTGTWCHTWKWDSCMALCHCVLCGSLVSDILVLLGRCKVTCVFTSLMVDSIFPHRLTYSLFAHLNTHKFFESCCHSAAQTRTNIQSFSFVLSRLKTVRYILSSPGVRYFSSEFSILKLTLGYCLFAPHIWLTLN